MATRAFVALLLSIGFYTLALGIVAFLLWVVYAEFVIVQHINLYLTLACLAGVWIILGALLPRRDRFVPPGPKLTQAEHPKLFAEIEAVAGATGQDVPAEVYLTHDINAWVTERGGFMGLGRRRVMGLGLPLMHLLSVSQFRAVLAHEFGHYHGGDTALGPWIYRTREAMSRAIQALAQRESVLQTPFLWYGNFFMRVTQAISRAQEFSADRLAAQTTGATPLREGLRMVHQAGPAFDAYWRNEVVPALNAGYRPPLSEGFQHFLGTTFVQQHMQKSLEAALREGKSDPYDTHPALRERIAALEGLPGGGIPEQDPVASSLLGYTGDLELGIITALSDSKTALALRPVAWTEVGEVVYKPIWLERVAPHRVNLANFSVSQLPQMCGQLDQLGESWLKEIGGQGSSSGYAQWVLGNALCAALSLQGWHIEALPGEDVVLHKGDDQLRPFRIVEALKLGSISAEDWQARCEALGLDGLWLAQVQAELWNKE
jgi:Zn-dependent protease with chaperone function